MTLDEAIQHCEEVATQCEGGEYIIPKMKECASEHRQLAEWLKELKAYKEQSGDAISGEAVLNAMYELCNTGETLKENPWRDNPHIDALVEAIEELPSVTPQPKTGMWIEHFDEIGKWYECDQCHTDWGGSVNFCPNCGCAMKGELE